MNNADPIRHIVGIMTGTSIDGIDAAMIRIDGSTPGMRATLLKFHSEGLGDLQPDLQRAAGQQPMTAGDFATLAWTFGELHAAVISRLLDSQPKPELIVVHGQTVYHKPPVSWQLINPAPIEAAFGCRVISDLRQPDLARGGEGAPITPLADWIMFRSSFAARAVINLGGFANVTVLPRDDGAHTIDDIRAFDVGACNHILNAVAMRGFGEPYDRDGAHAARGTADERAAAALFAGDAGIASRRRSLGTGDEQLTWVDQHAVALGSTDLAATAVRGIAQHIISTIANAGIAVDELLIAGGGALNRTLVRCIEEHATVPVRLTDECGVPVQFREAMAMAILGALRTDGIAVTLPRVTGRAEQR